MEWPLSALGNEPRLQEVAVGFRQNEQPLPDQAEQQQLCQRSRCQDGDALPAAVALVAADGQSAARPQDNMPAGSEDPANDDVSQRVDQDRHEDANDAEQDVLNSEVQGRPAEDGGH